MPALVLHARADLLKELLGIDDLKECPSDPSLFLVLLT